MVQPTFNVGPESLEQTCEDCRKIEPRIVPLESHLIPLPDGTYLAYSNANSIVIAPRGTVETPLTRKPMIDGVVPTEYDPELVAKVSAFFNRMNGVTDGEIIEYSPLQELDEREEDIEPERTYDVWPIFLQTANGARDTPASILLKELQKGTLEKRLPEEEVDKLITRVFLKHKPIKVKPYQEARYRTSLLAAIFDYNDELNRVMDYIKTKDVDSVLLNNYKPIADVDDLIPIVRRITQEGEIELRAFKNGTLDEKVVIHDGEKTTFDMVTQLVAVNNTNVIIYGANEIEHRYHGDFRLKAHRDGGELSLKVTDGANVTRPIVSQRLFYV